MTGQFDPQVEIKEVKVARMTLLKPAPDKCQQCAVEHEPMQPHDATSLYYQVAFQMEHNRYPTWEDALEHCPLHIRRLWIEELAKKGIMV